MAQQELVEAHRKAFSAQNAFLLGISASAIAFTFHSTADRTLTPSTWLILAAAVAWAASFAAGVRKAEKQLDAISYNLAVLEGERVGNSEAVKEGSEKFSNTRKSSARLHSVQLWSLLIGAVIFAAGHIAHMDSNAPSTDKTLITDGSVSQPAQPPTSE